MSDDHKNLPAKTSQTPDDDALAWLGLTNAPNWKVAGILGKGLGVLLVGAVPVLFLLALGAAGAVLYSTIANVVHGVSQGPNLGAGALIAAVLGAPFLIWGTIIKHKTLGFQKEGHMTDRISKAVEQLGAEKIVSRLMRNVTYKIGEITHSDYEGKSDPVTVSSGATDVTYGEWKSISRTVPNIEVRIGGLLSLERISQDSVRFDKGRDHVRVMEILCAYVRENSNARPPQISLRERYETATSSSSGPHDPPMSDEQFMQEAGIVHRDELDDAVSINALKHWANNLPKPRTDIQQALDIIGRRDQDKLEKAAGYTLDLRGSNLQGADMTDGNWSRSRMQEVRMEGAIFNRARLQRANLSEARLSGGKLSRARLERASLFETILDGSDLREAHLEGAFIILSILEGADLRGTVMDAQTRINFSVFAKVSVNAVNWSETSWTQNQINSMFGDASVDLPKGITRPEHWPALALPNGRGNDFETQYRRWLSNPATYTPPPPPHRLNP